MKTFVIIFDNKAWALIKAVEYDHVTATTIQFSDENGSKVAEFASESVYAIIVGENLEKYNPVASSGN